MKIKLSDYILEQSISDASIDDIEYERIKAELEVATAIAESYVKAYNMGLFQEVEADVPKDMPNQQDLVQPQASQVQDADKTLQKRWQDQLRSLGVEFEQEDHSNIPSSYIQKVEQATPGETIIGSYTGSDGMVCVFTAYNYLEENDVGKHTVLKLNSNIVGKRANGEIGVFSLPVKEIDLSNVNMSDLSHNKLMDYMKHDNEMTIEAGNLSRKSIFDYDMTKFDQLTNARNKIREDEFYGKKHRDVERNGLLRESQKVSSNADPSGTASKNMKAASVNALIFAMVSMMGKCINQLIAMEKSRRKYGKHVKGLTRTLNSMHVYLNDALSKAINDPSSFNETNFSQMVSNYNTVLNQAIQVFNQGASEKSAAFDKEAVSPSEASMAHGVDQLDAVLHSKVLFDNDTLIKTIMRNRGMIETKFSQLPPEAVASIIESTERYQQVIVPSIKQIQAELKRIQSDPTTMKPTTTPTTTSPVQPTQQNQPAPNPTSQTQQTQPPQQQKKPGELDAGNGMMMQQ